MKNIESLNKHRLNDQNKQEVVMVEVAQKMLTHSMPDQIIYGTKLGSLSMPNDYLTDKEKQIMLTTLQWLGSHVGQSYLKECNLLSEYKY